jgi:hypothetical protein
LEAAVTRLGVFAYASLVSWTSAGETLGRAVEPAAPARLRGWRRRWSIGRDNLSAEKTFARADGGELPRVCLGLNLEPADPTEEPPNGAVIEVTEAEIDRLDLREIRYDRFEVTRHVDPQPAGIARVFAYRAKPERFVEAPPPGSVVIAAYVQAVEEAFAELGPGELDAFRRTTGPPPAPVVEAILTRDEIPAGNPRRW